MNRLMDLLYARFRPLVESRRFGVVISLTLFANPVAIFPQVLAAFTAPDVNGISALMWYISATIQTAFVFYGIKNKSASMFLLMFVSLLESATIVITVHFRG